MESNPERRDKTRFVHESKITLENSEIGVQRGCMMYNFNNNGIYRGTDVNPSGGEDVAPTVFVKDSRYDKMMEAFGGVGIYVTSPDELKRAVNEAMDSGKPTLVNAGIFIDHNFISKKEC